MIVLAMPLIMLFSGVAVAFPAGCHPPISGLRVPAEAAIALHSVRPTHRRAL
ncbi:MAG: hypothetical protein ACLFS8_00230 [Clostridia bacterium]